MGQQSSLAASEATEQAKFARWEQEQAEYQQLNELTDASERLPLAMRNSFDYQLGESGELYLNNQSLAEVFETGVEVAKKLTETQPQFLVELQRRVLELDEYNHMKALASNADGPDTMLVISPTPDVVLEGKVDLNAYDTKRKKTMLRLFERSDKGVRVTSLSLDRSDKDGLRRVAAVYGLAIAEDESSEDILAKRGLTYRRELPLSGDLARATRKIYDDVLEQKYGGSWFGGREGSLAHEAKQFIDRQTDLLDQHMLEIGTLQKNNANKQQLEQARYNYAAALSRRLKGEADADSLSDAGAVAEARGETYSSDCATGTSASQSAQELGFNNKRQVTVSKVCPLCRTRNVVTTIEGNMISGSCGCKQEICTGKILSRARIKSAKADKAAKSAAVAIQPKIKSLEKSLQPPKSELIKRQYGKFALLQSSIGFGGREEVVIDKRTQQVIAKL